MVANKAAFLTNIAVAMVLTAPSKFLPVNCLLTLTARLVAGRKVLPWLQLLPDGMQTSKM